MRLPKLGQFNLKSKVLEDCFGSKYITVLVFDDSGGFYAFPLKNDYLLDSKFFVRINDQILLLDLDHRYIETYRHKLAKPVRIILYTTHDYRPVKLSELRDIESFCKQNRIESIDEDMAKVLIAVSAITEQHIKLGSEHTVVTIDDILSYYLKGMDENSVEYLEQRTNLIRAHTDLNLVNVLGPLDPVTQYLKSKIYGNPLSLANVIMTLRNMDFEWRKISNPAKGPFKHWLLIAIIIGVIISIGVAGYFLSAPDSSQDVFDALVRLDQAGAPPIEEPASSPAQDLFNEDVTSNVFDSVDDIIDNALDSGSSQAPDVRQSSTVIETCHIAEDGTTQCTPAEDDN